MIIFRSCVKTLAVLALLAGGLGACAAPRAYDLGAYSQVNKLQQVGCLPRLGKDD